MIRNVSVKRVVFILLSALFTFGAFAQSSYVKSLVPPSYLDELIRDGNVLRNSDGSNGFLLLPNAHYADQIIANSVEKEEGNYPFVYEGLYYISKAEILLNSKSSKTSITIDDVADVCRSVSKMKGMTYFSHSKNKERELYEEAYMFKEEELDKRRPTPIPDENTGNADGQVSYSLLKDSSFGRNKYKLSYFQDANEFLIEFCLMDGMGFGPFNALTKGKMKINLLVVDCGEDLLIYLCTDVDANKFPGIEGMIKDSMTARMEAVYNWFLVQF